MKLGGQGEAHLGTDFRAVIGQADLVSPAADPGNRRANISVS